MGELGRIVVKLMEKETGKKRRYRIV